VKLLAFAFALVACHPSKDSAVIVSEDAAVAPAPPAPPAPAPSSPSLRVDEAPSDTDALTLIRTKRLQAKSEGRVLVVYVGATWCEPCKKLKAEIASGRLDRPLGRVTLLAFDADKDVDRLGAVGYTFKFVPFVALPGPDGRPADTQQASGKGGQAWRELLGKLEEWQRSS
jgi:thiol-disulfide isomerase/thioredoxin